jgi:hypothetical protein
MNLQLLNINGETILIICLYGKNRSENVTAWSKKIMVDHWNLPVNYLECPFPGVSHGQMMNYVISQTIDSIKPDYYLWIDNDALFLREDAMDFIYSMIKNKITVFGHAWMSNHKFTDRGVVNAYASQATLAYSTKLFNQLGRPDCDHFIPRSDTSEEITYKAKELGFCVSLLYPNYVVDPNTPLDSSCFLGFGNFYGQNMMFHCSQCPNPKHEELFIETCKRVLAGEFEG